MQKACGRLLASFTTAEERESLRSHMGQTKNRDEENTKFVLTIAHHMKRLTDKEARRQAGFEWNWCDLLNMEVVGLKERELAGETLSHDERRILDKEEWGMMVGSGKGEPLIPRFSDVFLNPAQKVAHRDEL